MVNLVILRRRLDWIGLGWDRVGLGSGWIGIGLDWIGSEGWRVGGLEGWRDGWNEH